MSGSRSGVANHSSMKPVFIDQEAVDVVVYEHRWMKLTSGEKRHAAHRLMKQRAMSVTRAATLLRVSGATILHMLENPPPPILDVDAETGELVSVD